MKPLQYVFFLCAPLCLAPRAFAAPAEITPADTTSADATPEAAPAAARSNDDTPEEAEETEEAPGLYFGADLFAGVSNLEGQKKFRDEFWASGAGLGDPSVLQLRLLTRKKLEAKIAVGVGPTYTRSISELNQPVEAWVRAPLGKAGALTVGKFYTPFALQEWQYEPKWGAMIEASHGASTLALAAVKDHVTRRTNIYARAGHDFNQNINAGISLASGEGLSFGTSFSRALGLDVSASRSDWKLSAEYVAMRSREDAKFRFGWAMLSYEKWKRLKPFLARYDWKDTGGEFGNFRSNAAGAQYFFTPHFSLEGGYARVAGTDVSNRDVFWLQVHYAREWNLSRARSTQPFLPQPPSVPSTSSNVP